MFFDLDFFFFVLRFNLFFNFIGEGVCKLVVDNVVCIGLFLIVEIGLGCVGVVVVGVEVDFLLLFLGCVV